jgi:BNR repeat-containing family member/Right handed beta helix region
MTSQEDNRRHPAYCAAPNPTRGRRRTVPTALLALALLCPLLLLALSATAETPPTAPGARLVPVAKGWAKNSVNAVVFRRNSVVSHDGVQYLAFYDADAQVVLGKRRLGSAEWTLRTTEYSGNARDAHNSISIMVDGDGYLHLAWDHHGGNLKYSRSIAPGSLELTKTMSMVGAKENRVTYPEFYRLPDGDLLFLYRDGGSGRGDLMMNHYDRESRTWTRRQDAFINGESERNAYWQMCTDAQGTIHISWVWRETGDVASNHDLCYAKSTDEGRNWTTSTDDPYELPITADSAEYAARIEQNSNLINTTSMCADRHGNPYIATYWTPAGSETPQYHLVHHDGTTWTTMQISQRTTPFHLQGGGTKRIPMSRCQILAAANGSTDAAYLVYRDEERDSRVSVAVCADLRQPTWRVHDLTDHSVGRWEPSYDTELWKAKGLLHLYVQRVGQGDGETTEAVPPQEIAILEWNPRAQNPSVGDFYVAPTGSAENTGSAASPLTLSAAVARVAEQNRTSGLPEGGVTVWVAGGRYPIRESIQLGPEFQGSPDKPIVIRARPGEEVIFDGGVAIDPTSFTPVTDEAERARLAVSAADKIVAASVTDPQLIEALKSQVILILTVDGHSFLPSVFPNEGYARLLNEPVVPEVCPPGIPIGKQAYGVRAGHHPQQESGKPVGWKGTLDEPRGAWANIGEKADPMAGSWPQWQAELARNNRRHILTGFLDADWFLGSQPIVAADPEKQAIHLSRVLAYGWAWRKTKPFKIFGLLCELDAPGEWHFDADANRLYLYPPTPITEDTSIAIPAATDFLTIDGASHVSIIGLNVQNLAGGTAYTIRRGDNNLIASATIRSCTATGASIEGTNNRVLGCDFIDLNRHVRLGGGRRSPDEITAGHNEVANCHFYQAGFRHQKVNIGLGGVGNAFRNNLVHNSLGQAMTVGGNDHLIERNEFFNVGFDEGDGGAVYSGADLTGYGIVYRHNFFHHLMHVPGKVTRSGIHLDDLQAGSTCEGNIFYKSAEKGIFMNGGAGHRIVGNVFLEGKYGALNRGSGGRKNYDRQLGITNDPDNPHKGSKKDYVGRAERVVGADGWTKPPWSQRYPLFTTVMSDAGEFGRLWPIRCHVEGNYYYGNTGRDTTIWDRCAPEVRAKSVLKPDLPITPEAFVNYGALDLRLVDPESGPKIPFEAIGLHLDEYRAAMPDKTHYRRVVREFFDGIGSMPGTHKRIDTARVVEDGPVLRR